MRTTIRAASVATLAAVVFAAGGLGMFRTPRQEAPAAVSAPGSGAGDAAAAVGGGSLRSTIASLQERLRAVPEDGRAFAALGAAYVQAARVWSDPSYYPKAEEALEQALGLRADDDADPLIAMGTLALARHDFAAALRWGEHAAAVNPDDASVYGVIGDAQVELGRYREAFVTFDTMVRTRPDLASYARISYALELRGRVGPALRAMRLAEGAAGTPEDRAWAAAQVGDLAFRAGRLELARISYERSRAAWPMFAPARAGLARVSWARGDLRAAIAGMRWVVARTPLPEHVIALGDLLRAAGRGGAARGWYDLARVEAEVLRANGVDVDVELALFEADHGDPDVAVREARRGWAARRSIHAADALAWALYRAGRADDAVRFARAALRLGTRDAALHYHAGMIQLGVGDRRAAAEHLATALQLNPHFSIAHADDAARVLDRLGAA